MNHTTLAQQKMLYKRAKVAYEQGKPVMTDAEFDKLEDRIKAKAPAWSELRKTGTAVKSKKMKAALARPMPSLHKVYPEQSSKWVKARKSVFAMDKLDGSALLLTLNDGKPVQAVTRGDGTIGGDISFLIPWLKIPKKVALKGEVHIRCEAVMKDKVFDKIYFKKYDNPRNLVAGILNRSMTGEPTPDEQMALCHTDIICLGLFGSKLSTGLPQLRGLGFDTVFHYDLANPTPERLTAFLNARRKVSPYSIDGIVIADMEFELDYKNADKPKDIVAFKVNAEDETVEANVKRIIYQVTGHGRIVPKVEIEPVRLGGVTIKHATVHNAQWMIDNKIGPGAKIKIVRSGGVIPKIVGVVKAAKIQYPEIGYELKGKHFVVAEASTNTANRIKVLNIHKFMTTMGIELVGTKTIESVLFRFPTVESWLEAWWNRALANKLVLTGVGDKTAGKIEAEFYAKLGGEMSRHKIPMKQLMVASTCFPVGVGMRKLSQLEQGGISMDSLVALSAAKKDLQLANLVAGVFGFDDKMAAAVVKGVAAFRPHLKMYKQYMNVDGSLPAIKRPAKGTLTGKCVSWTGYRSKDEEAAVTEAGGEVVSFGGRTHILLYREDGKASSKVDAAVKKGCRVCTFKELKL